MKLQYTLIFTCLLFSIEVEQISQCGNAHITYYDVDGEGNCGFGDLHFRIPTAAAEVEMYKQSQTCGVCYELMGEGGTLVVMIADGCPGCTSVSSTKKIHLDLDQRIFGEVDLKSKGNVGISMRMVPCEVTGNVILHITETNPSYFNAYVTNHKIGVKALKVSFDGGEFKEVKRESWNRFVASGLGNVKTIKVKVVSFADEEIECPGATSITQGDYDCGKQFSANHFFDIYSNKKINKNTMSDCCKKPSLIDDLSKCEINTNYQDTGEYKQPYDSEDEDSGQDGNNGGDNNNDGFFARFRNLNGNYLKTSILLFLIITYIF